MAIPKVTKNIYVALEHIDKNGYDAHHQSVVYDLITAD